MWSKRTSGCDYSQQITDIFIYRRTVGNIFFQTVSYVNSFVKIDFSHLGCDFFSPNTNTQIHKRRFSLSAKEKKVRRDEKPSFVYLFCSKSDFFR